MWYMVGIVLTIINIFVGYVLAFVSKTPAICMINIAGLLLFLGAINILFSPARFSILTELFRADLLQKWFTLSLLGISIGLIVGGFARYLVIEQIGRTFLGQYIGISGVYLVPVMTFLILPWVILLTDFFMAGSVKWNNLRSFVQEDIRATVALVALAVVIDAIVISIVARSWVPLELVLGISSPVVLIFLINLLFPSSRIWAVARHMIAEGIRMKIALVFIGIILIVLPSMPFIIAGDGVTLTSRVQNFLSYSLGSVGFLLSLLTVFLSCSSISNEIQLKQIFMVVSKPIPRWHFFVGKWLGIVTLNAAILLFTGITIWGFTWYLKSRPTEVPDDQETLNYEVLNVRHGTQPKPPDFAAIVEERMRRLQEEGALTDVDPSRRAQVRPAAHKLPNAWPRILPSNGERFPRVKLPIIPSPT